MNKKLISKCCHSEVSESVYFTCLKCGQVCEVIEIEEPQPIQKEEVKEVCPECGGTGQVVIGENRVSHDMAIDAGEPEMEGMHHSYVYGECLNCEGVGYIIKTPTTSDTFIEGIIKKFREQFVASDNRFLTGTETVGKAEKFIRQSFKSSLQSQRQSILEEIEKKIEELGIQADKADTQIQNEDFNEFFSKEDAEKLIYDNLIIIKTLEDIKQLLKNN